MLGRHSSVRAWSLALIVLTMNLAMLPVTAEGEEGEHATETLRDGRVIGVLTPQIRSMSVHGSLNKMNG
tara:strand:+ start:1113 stop:1319 length:207 start_codon:yes stop_codon:yes gene_type:complete